MQFPRCAATVIVINRHKPDYLNMIVVFNTPEQGWTDFLSDEAADSAKVAFGYDGWISEVGFTPNSSPFCSEEVF